MATNFKPFKILKTEGCFYQCEFEWFIENFSDLNKNFSSPELSFNSDFGMQLKIIVEFSTKMVDFKKFKVMRVGLQRTDSQQNVAKILLVFEILDNFRNLYLKEHVNSSFSSHVKKCRSKEIERPSNEKNVYGVNKTIFYLKNSLIIKGIVVVMQHSFEKPLEISNKCVRDLQNDYKSMLENNQFTDVTLKVGDEIIQAHKFVLCARSPVFKKMFEHDMKESACNSVTLIDIEKPVLKAFLNFLYTGNLEEPKFDAVICLYSVADKYQVETLRETCRTILISEMSANTVCLIIKLADIHSDTILKEISIKFICDNFIEVQKTVYWRKLLNSSPGLASEILSRSSTKVLEMFSFYSF